MLANNQYGTNEYTMQYIDEMQLVIKVVWCKTVNCNAWPLIWFYKIAAAAVW